MASGVLRVESVTDYDDTHATCIVRCVQGSVKVGDVISCGRSQEGRTQELLLRLEMILRYERAVSLLDTPHVAKIKVAGVGASAVVSCVQLLTESG